MNTSTLLRVLLFSTSTLYAQSPAPGSEPNSPAPTELGSPAVLEATTELLQAQNQAPRPITHLPTLATENGFRLNFKLDTARVPDSSGRVSSNLGFHIDYGWKPWAQITLSMPQLVLYEGESRNSRFLEEVGLSTSFLVVEEASQGADLTLTPGFTVFDSGVAFMGTAAITKRPQSTLRVDASITGRFRTHYNFPDYGHVSVVTGLTWSPIHWVGLSLSSQAWFFPDRVRTISEDMVFGKKVPASTAFPSMMYTLNPKFSVAVRDNSTLFIDGRIIVNESARSWFGHTVGLGFESRM